MVISSQLAKAISAEIALLQRQILELYKLLPEKEKVESKPRVTPRRRRKNLNAPGSILLAVRGVLIQQNGNRILVRDIHSEVNRRLKAPASRGSIHGALLRLESHHEAEKQRRVDKPGFTWAITPKGRTELAV